MAVDRNLFMYDLTVVAVMKNEGHYVKEWLDYHLLAGVNHFFIYDNDSPDNQKEILQPYIENNLVTYIFFPEKSPQFPAYNDAIKKFRFSCRYMAFIDGDEFLFPQENKSITEVVDEILAGKNNVGALAMNYHLFGSSFQEKADYSRGLLERFTRRSSDDNPETGNVVIKNIILPTHTDYFDCPHKINHFEGFFSVDENGKIVLGNSNSPPTTEKIVVNHYYSKSLEEYLSRNKRGDVVYSKIIYDEKKFNDLNKNLNEIFDDGILKYRDEKILAVNNIYGGGDRIKFFAEKNKINYNKIFNALLQNLLPTLEKNLPQEFFAGKLETFLTCLAVSSHLKENILEENAGKFFEEISLNAIYKSLSVNVSVADVRLILSELPKILSLNYPVVENIRTVCMKFIQELQKLYRSNVTSYNPMLWLRFYELDNLLEILQTFDHYTKK